MLVQIAPSKFEAGHEALLKHMLVKSNGVPFINFQHPFLVADEIEPKKIIYGKAKEILSLLEWEKWLQTPGKIIQVTKEACAPAVSKNLLYHRKGIKASTEKALYRVETVDQIKGLEQHLFQFLKAGSSLSPTEFGLYFDTFADYLRENSLGCNWRFVAYLAFLANNELYFPIVPENFDRLLDFYGIQQRVSGFVSWERYKLPLDLAALLKEKLAIYGHASMIEIQSYMWVVSYLIENGPPPDGSKVIKPDLATELKTRQYRADERERIGLLGEWFVFEQERGRLKSAGRTDLAEQVRLVSPDNDGCGYDILSFNLDETELHIEVKSTKNAQAQDDGFWLTDNEKVQAENDQHWYVYRVWGIDTKPIHENLGNIVQQGNGKWKLTASNWFVRRK